MIELIFSDSGAASLSMAKHTRNKDAVCGVEITTDDQGNETTRPFTPPPYTGPTIQGDSSDIAALWLTGDVGDISVLPDWTSRLKIMREISQTHAFETDEWIEQEQVRANALVQRLEEAAQAGEPIRIWWSDIAHETCGYYWAMSILKDATGPVTSVKVPRLWPGENQVAVVNGTGELEPEKFHSLLSQEKTVGATERKALALYWGRLVSENAPLRAVINGVPCSVPEDFYDYALYNAFPQGEFKVVEALGRAIGKGPGGVSDWWYAHRLRHMIAAGIVEVVAEGEKFYYTTVKKAEKQ